MLFSAAYWQCLDKLDTPPTRDHWDPEVRNKDRDCQFVTDDRKGGSPFILAQAHPTRHLSPLATRQRSCWLSASPALDQRKAEIRFRERGAPSGVIALLSHPPQAPTKPEIAGWRKPHHRGSVFLLLTHRTGLFDWLDDAWLVYQLAGLHSYLSSGLWLTAAFTDGFTEEAAADGWQLRSQADKCFVMLSLSRWTLDFLCSSFNRMDTMMDTVTWFFSLIHTHVYPVQ